MEGETIHFGPDFSARIASVSPGSPRLVELTFDAETVSVVENHEQLEDAELLVVVARRSDGLGLYRFKYLWSENVYVGVMAQEVALLRPDAVIRDALTGYMAVNYAQLGLQPLILQ